MPRRFDYQGARVVKNEKEQLQFLKWKIQEVDGIRIGRSSTTGGGGTTGGPQAQHPRRAHIIVCQTVADVDKVVEYLRENLVDLVGKQVTSSSYRIFAKDTAESVISENLENLYPGEILIGTNVVARGFDVTPSEDYGFNLLIHIYVVMVILIDSYLVRAYLNLYLLD